MDAMVLLMQHTKIVNWAYNAVDVCMYVDYNCAGIKYH